jgi:hypothetical protein
MTMDVQRKRRSYSGCLPCRRRKKRCDLRKPECGGCERNVLLCDWTSTSSSYSHDGGSASPHQHQMTTCSTSVPARRHSATGHSSICHQPSTTAHILRSPLSALLYEHWLERTGNTISGHRGASNSFITTLPRIALQYPDSVLHSILALSGVHYTNCYEKPEVKIETLAHLSVTLRTLKHKLTTYAAVSDPNPVPLLATTLVLCFIEVRMASCCC